MAEGGPLKNGTADQDHSYPRHLQATLLLQKSLAETRSDEGHWRAVRVCPAVARGTDNTRRQTDPQRADGATTDRNLVLHDERSVHVDGCLTGPHVWRLPEAGRSREHCGQASQKLVAHPLSLARSLAAGRIPGPRGSVSWSPLGPASPPRVAVPS
ncbi:hypothetical protein O9K51_00496 [Purpureocillium lavendulum]|uniref:Uncharacterized protein n=1 Tax=Purpureocillium lavendulum TaxID=1247861 RepID=A0AB34G3A6_9HYPO|nr:hypothetical protein O9K51_00496 [Purpureocillium lavendulum]